MFDVNLFMEAFGNSAHSDTSYNAIRYLKSKLQAFEVAVSDSKNDTFSCTLIQVSLVIDIV